MSNRVASELRRHNDRRTSDGALDSGTKPIDFAAEFLFAGQNQFVLPQNKLVLGWNQLIVRWKSEFWSGINLFWSRTNLFRRGIQNSGMESICFAMELLVLRQNQFDARCISELSRNNASV
jgi:hypothetical protein